MIVVEEECHLEGVEDLHELPREWLNVSCQGLCVCVLSCGYDKLKYNCFVCLT